MIRRGLRPPPGPQDREAPEGCFEPAGRRVPSKRGRGRCCKAEGRAGGEAGPTGGEREAGRGSPLGVDDSRAAERRIRRAEGF